MGGGREWSLNFARLFAEYLRESNWREVDSEADRYVQLMSPVTDNDVLLPLSDTVSDFASLLTTAVRQVAASEGKSESDLATEVVRFRFDTVESVASSARDDSIGAQDFVRLVSGTSAVLHASALAAAASTPRASYQGAVPRLVAEFAGRLRVGHTRPGSFALPLYSPVRVPRDQPDDEAALKLAVTPFERMAVERAALAVGSGVEAASKVRDGLDMHEAFVSAVADGVSSNFCRGLAELCSLDAAVNVTLDFDFTRRLPARMRRQVITLDREFAPIYVEAAAYLQPASAPRSASVSGKVVLLERGTDDEAGLIGIETVYEGRQRTVLVELDQQAYALAIRAHDRKVTVYAEGTMQVVRRRRYLDPVTRFEIVRELSDIGASDVTGSSDAEG